jgi:hypothetical protein
VRAFSGATGEPLYTLTRNTSLEHFGFSIATTPDITGDLVKDLIIGAPGVGLLDSNPGHVYVYDGRTGDFLYSLAGVQAGSGFGRAVSGFADTNSDGFGEIVVGSPNETAGFQFRSGAVRVFSGTNGILLNTFLGSGTPQAKLGFAIADLGDANNDGISEIAVTAPFEDNSSGRIYILRPQTGLIPHLQIQSGIPYTRLGFDVAATGDMNGDGVGDLITSTPAMGFIPTEGGLVRVYSGQSGGLLYEQVGDTFPSFFGFSVAGNVDINGDNRPDFLVGDPGLGINDGSASGVHVFLVPGAASGIYLSALEPNTLNLSWIPDNGDVDSPTGTITCHGATPGAIGAFGISFAPGDFALAPSLPLLLAVDPTNLIFVGGFGFDTLGRVQSNGVSRQHPAIAGTLLYYQFFETSPFPASSNGMSLLMIS